MLHIESWQRLSRGKCFCQECNNDITKTSIWPFGAPYTTEPRDEKDVGLLIGVIIPSYQRNIELLPDSGGKENYINNPEDPQGCLLVFPCPIVKITLKIQKETEWVRTQAIQERNVWLTPPDKEPREAEILAESKEIQERQSKKT